MKKFAVITIVILALMFSMLPMNTAFAKASTPQITVRNQTGAPVTLVIQNEVKTRSFTFAAGAVVISVPADTYSYIAQTTCGNKYGTLNMSRAAVLHFSCVKGEHVKIARPLK